MLCYCEQLHVVIDNWLEMLSKEKIMRRMFCMRGLAMSNKIRIFLIFCFIYKAYLYGTLEEFVMFTLMYFNRMQLSERLSPLDYISKHIQMIFIHSKENYNCLILFPSDSIIICIQMCTIRRYVYIPGSAYV